MNTKKGFASILLILLAVVVIGGGTYFYTQNNPKEISSQEINIKNSLPVAQDIKQATPPTPKTEIKDILSLSVPSPIKQNRITSTELHLTHSVSYKHTDLCDMRDGSHVNEDFTDYSNVVYLYEGNLNQIIEKTFPHSLTGDFIDTSGNLKLQAGFIDKLTIDSRDIYKITTGVEGCGYYTYIIPYNNKAIVIRKNFIPPFSGNFTEETINKFKNISGVIKPEEADIIFNNILNQIINKL